MRILRAADHRKMPWKNGKGVTTEIAVFPEGASVDSFDWRISMAKVPNSGPFSAFAGINRVLAVLEGEMVLTVDGRPPEKLDPSCPAMAFPGDTPTSAEVLHEVTDLNVMIRRGRYQAQLSRLDRAVARGDGEQTFVLLRDNAQLVSGETLGPDDVLHLATSETVTFETMPSHAWLIEINFLSS
ncbi:HutD/Ves family protein [Phyllobacterium meliloti]|uniref:HutD/Ves family protein n=1 Tax=Phyllobacterium meliloti TaxID=555317 RepID=UPI001D1509A9|nr:HutD family protein [Phyllobacterium sp. T1293]UGX85440.1 HutD family protein [Phyllobacterium sp. T1293]